MYGGFNGQTKDRVIVFHPGQFGNVKERATTASSVPGTGRRSCARSGVWRSRTVSSPRPGTTLGSAGSNGLTEGMLVDTVFSTTSKVVESVVPLCQGPGELSQLILYTAY